MQIENVSLKFEWDKGNIEKNFKKHGISYKQIEEVFFNKPLYLFEDIYHSYKEQRYIALGHDRLFKLIFISFTVRQGLVRVISARPMSKREKSRYEKNI